MAKSRTDKSPYPSRYAPNHWVTPAQYIIEFVCEQSAKFSGKDLPVRFWKDKEWQSFFVSQTRAANRLLKKYSEKAILNTIKKKRIRSLHPKWIESVIKEEQKQIDSLRLLNENKEEKREKTIKKPETRSSNFSSGSMKKLLELDEEI